jgi:hypothetical protein
MGRLVRVVATSTPIWRERAVVSDRLSRRPECYSTMLPTGFDDRGDPLSKESAADVSQNSGARLLKLSC